MSSRGTLIIEPSHLRAKAVVLRNPETGATLHSHPSIKAAVGYCRRTGYHHTFPMPTLKRLLEQNAD
ncbi:MAG: hypothetical protein V4563_17850 [Pseudomonadota bacterium]